MSVKVRFLGTAAIEVITSNNKRVLMDPFLDENPVSPVKADDISPKPNGEGRNSGFINSSFLPFFLLSFPASDGEGRESRPLIPP